MSQRAPTRRAVRRAAVLVGTGSLGVQLSAALSRGLFTTISPPQVTGIRLLIAAAVMNGAVRPRLRGRSREQWQAIGLYGLTMIAMNLCIYEAIARIPLGVAITLEFLGPAAVAAVGARHRGDLLAAVAALAGVALLAGPGGTFDAAGYGFALLAGAFFGLYAVLAARVGQGEEHMDAIALSLGLAAALGLPLALLAAPELTAHQWLIVTTSSLLGVIVPYVVDTLAGRITTSRVVGTLFSIDPVMGAAIGWLALGEALGWQALLGIGLVTAAGGYVVWSAEPDPSSG